MIWIDRRLLYNKAVLLHLDQDVAPLLSMEETDDGGRDRKTSLSHGEFVPPQQCVRKEEWFKDGMYQACMQCHDEFSMVSVLRLNVTQAKCHSD